MNDHVVGAMNIKLDLGTRIAVSKAKLCLFDAIVLDGLQHLGEVDADTADLEEINKGVHFSNQLGDNTSCNALN